MSDRHSAYIVVLDKDARDDDSEAWMNAIRMLKGVISVKPVTNDAASMIAQERVKRELYEKLHQFYTSL